MASMPHQLPRLNTPPRDLVFNIRYGFVAYPEPAFRIDVLFLDDVWRSFFEEDRDQRWLGYYVKPSLDLMSRMRKAPPWTASAPPALQQYLNNEDYRVILMTRIRTGQHGSPLAIEMTWIGSERQAQIIMTGLEQRHKAEDVRRARRAIALLWELDGRGRHSLEEEHWGDWRGYAKRARELKRKHPILTYKQVAARLGVPYGTLRRWMTRLDAEERREKPEE